MTAPPPTKPTPPAFEDLPEGHQRMLRKLEAWSKEPPEEDEEFWRELDELLENNPLDF